jgi:hypothetical protein
MHLLRPAGRTSSLQETKGGGVPAPMPAGPSLSHRQFGPKVNTGNYRNVEMVPTSDVRRYATQSLRYGPGSSEWDGLKSHVHEHGMEPGILEYNHKTGEAHLGEGNHRLALAEQQGWSHFPVRVQRTSSAVGRPTPRKVVPNEHGYVKGELRPSEVGLDGSSI